MKCTTYKNPRMLANPVGFEVDGLGFYHIPYTPVVTAKHDNKTALVRIEGGSLSIPQLVQELARLIPERWNWEVKQLERNSFVVPFPTKSDLQRSVAFGKADIKEHGVSLHFEEWREEEDGDELDTIWVRVFRLPSKLRVFPVLWAIGSMLGATQAVDMLGAEGTMYGRVQVAVMNVQRVPRKLDTVINKRFYQVGLQVEGRDPEPGDDGMDVDGGDDQENGNNEGNGNQDNGDENKRENGNRKDGKQDKGNDSQSSKHNQVSGEVKKNTSSALVEEIESMEDFDIMRSSKYPKNNSQEFEGMHGMAWASGLHDSIRGACGLPLDDGLLISQAQTSDAAHGDALDHGGLVEVAQPTERQAALMDAGRIAPDHGGLVATQVLRAATSGLQVSR
ncbi:hypothetical protein EJB05_57668, partial [Eragrostis curvula]